MASGRERLSRKCSVKRGRSLINDELQARFKQIKKILQKRPEDCSQEELNALGESPEMVVEVKKRALRRDNVKARMAEV